MLIVIDSGASYSSPILASSLVSEFFTVDIPCCCDSIITFFLSCAISSFISSWIEINCLSWVSCNWPTLYGVLQTLMYVPLYYTFANSSLSCFIVLYFCSMASLCCLDCVWNCFITRESLSSPSFILDKSSSHWPRITSTCFV